MGKRIRNLYVFVVLAMLSACGGGSSSDSGGGDSSVPGTVAPTEITISAEDGKVTISWNSVNGADSYNIYWSNSPGVTKSTGTKISGVTSPFTHTGLTNGLTYYYVGTAVNPAGESGESVEVSATPVSALTVPAAPTGVSGSAGNGELTISWSPVAEATSYNIYWSTSPGVTKSTGTKISGVTSPYTLTGSVNGSTYYCIVTAVNSVGEGNESSEVTVTPLAVAPAKPTEVIASAGNEQITISWSAVTDATSYNIYWATSPGLIKGSGTKIEGVTSPYTHTGLINGTTYYYIITAVNAIGEGIESIEVSAAPFLAPPPMPF